MRKRKRENKSSDNTEVHIAAGIPIDRAMIVGKHLQAMLDELRAEGWDIVGVAGGLVLPPQQGHTFYLFDTSYCTADGKPVERDGFVEDVAQSMLRTIED